MTRMTAKPKKGTATAQRRAKANAKKRNLAAVCALVRERDGDQCRVCGSAMFVEVHHIVFRSAGGKDTPDNLICLCGDCHDQVHDRRLWLSGNADIPRGLVIEWKRSA